MPDFRFRLPPRGQLTQEQQIALNELRPVLITGGPGSGKTVVSIYRFLRRIREEGNTLFFTFNRTLMSSIRGTLIQDADIYFEEINGNDEVRGLVNSSVRSIHEWYGEQFHAPLAHHNTEQIGSCFSELIRNRRQNYSEVFVDEAQDMRPAVIENLPKLAGRVSCGADRAQDLQKHYTRPADSVIEELLSAYEPIKRQPLVPNFRNTREIFGFARKFVPEDLFVQRMDLQELAVGEEPIIETGLSDIQQLERILMIIESPVFQGSNVGIIAHSSLEIITIRDHLIKKGYHCDGIGGDEHAFSYYYERMDYNHKKITERRLRTPFILTYESCKGLEFDVVILPFFNSVSWALTGNKRENGVVKYGADGNPIKWTTPNHYYVATTRARRWLYVLCQNKPHNFPFL